MTTTAHHDGHRVVHEDDVEATRVGPHGLHSLEPVFCKRALNVLLGQDHGQHLAIGEGVCTGRRIKQTTRCATTTAVCSVFTHRRQPKLGFDKWEIVQRHPNYYCGWCGNTALRRWGGEGRGRKADLQRCLGETLPLQIHHLPIDWKGALWVCSIFP